jgi:hypothetical protein
MHKNHEFVQQFPALDSTYFLCVFTRFSFHSSLSLPFLSLHLRLKDMLLLARDPA